MNVVRCLETRKLVNGLRRRTYITPEGTRVVTYEVPKCVLTALGDKRLAEVLAGHARGEDTHALAARRRAYVAANISVKSTALAAELGISEARVRQIKNQLKGPNEHPHS